MPMHQLQELENTFNVSSTGFSLRGNANIFNHMYEYCRTFGGVPLHHLNVRLGKTDGNAIYLKLLDMLIAEFGSENISYRKAFDVSLYDDPKDGLESVTTKSELIHINGTAISVFAHRSYGTNLTAEVFVGRNEEYDVMSKILMELANSYKKADDTPLNKFYMITHDGQSLDLLEYDVNQNKFEDFDLDLQYNDDFKEVSANIISTLSKKDGTTGIALLHGAPGSGKTTYLRYLISTVNKRIIYMPPDMANQLGTPSFFNFIRQYPNSVLIIEDGENILRKRLEDSGTSPAISNLLNLSDGIMGDALNIQVVCTFNADIAEIDEALLRPGRLIANYYFGTLKPEKTKALFKHLHGDEAEPQKEEMTVAEIYKAMEMPTTHEKPKTTRKIGFLP